jgi:hypothetical protein
MMFGKIIGTVGFTGRPVEVELVLSDTIAKPVVTHVKCFGAFHADLRFKDAGSSGTVGFERSTRGRLRMSHFDEGSKKRDSGLSVKKKTAGLSFGSGGCNTFEGFAEYVNSTIGSGIGRIGGGTGVVSEEKMTSSTTAGIGQNEIGGIGTDG